MTNTTTLAPTDAEIEELLKSCGMRWVERSFWQLEDADLHPAIRAVLAKWGAPAPASHEALTTALAACRDAFPLPASGSASEFEWQGAMTDPLGVPAYVRACAAPPAQEARVPLTSEQRSGL